MGKGECLKALEKQPDKWFNSQEMVEFDESDNSTCVTRSLNGLFEEGYAMKKRDETYKVRRFLWRLNKAKLEYDNKYV